MQTKGGAVHITLVEGRGRNKSLVKGSFPYKHCPTITTIFWSRAVSWQNGSGAENNGLEGDRKRNDLTYSDTFASRPANQAKFEKGGMQVLSKEDTKTVELCRAMYVRGECPLLLVVFDPCEGYTVQADGPIKDMTFITEYTGDVDYNKNREHDDCDSMMTLLLATHPSNSLVICPDKRGNIARFINGINNHTVEGRRKRSLKCVRYSVNGESQVFLLATRDISKGERLYYDYNGYEHEYPIHHFV